MISRAKKYVAVLLVFVCVCMIFSPLTAYAAEDSSQHETVKVGFFAMDGYHMMDEEGNRSGYGARRGFHVVAIADIDNVIAKVQRAFMRFEQRFDCFENILACQFL